MRVVLDTNILISAILIRGGNEDRILRAFQRREFELVLSPPVIEEIGRALFYPRVRKAQWFTADEIALLLEFLVEESVMVPGKLTVKVCRDPDDNKFLAAAVEAGATHVVTGDKDLLVVGTYRGVEVSTSATFLRVLRDLRKPGA